MSEGLKELIGKTHIACEVSERLPLSDGYPSWIDVLDVDMPMIKIRNSHGGKPIWVNVAVIRTMHGGKDG